MWQDLCVCGESRRQYEHIFDMDFSSIALPNFTIPAHSLLLENFVFGGQDNAASHALATVSAQTALCLSLSLLPRNTLSHVNASTIIFIAIIIIIIIIVVIVL